MTDGQYTKDGEDVLLKRKHCRAQSQTDRKEKGETKREKDWQRDLHSCIVKHEDKQTDRKVQSHFLSKGIFFVSGQMKLKFIFGFFFCLRKNLRDVTSIQPLQFC